MSKTRSQRSQSIPGSASVKDDNILCCVWDAVVQIEPSDLYDELVKYASKSKNMKFYCDNCVKHANGFKGLLQMLNEKFESIDSSLKTSLTDESLKDEDILKIFRQGKKPSVSSPPRLVIVMFINLSAKVLVMRRLFRLALLDEKMRERCGRAMENSEISKACYQTGLNLGLLNIRSIRSKYDIIHDLLSNDLDICVLTETWHGSSDDIFVKLAMPYGFSFMDYLRPHDPNQGGIIVYFKNVFKVKKLELPVVNFFESLAIKFRCGKKTILFLAVYRPGSVPITPAFFDELTSLLEQISLLADYVILTGDLNVHLEKVHMVFIPIMVWSKYVFRFR
ncbi:hypothetical protein HELRODRAFT_184333 [Helobdella robusta]|uniref:Endonuclease/exonuclease/phosphatase domain-containing protein n=1 Tax=Helobdella robusta TaxID=6412 RepID=T1FL07_HELRO|nr:hypothetical protein HELRODRAFT_184333 [Helobdella robusta]ESO00994.1 hypothetical protein HELRODRAFT_184333 [Helobdella robusta]